MVNESQSTQSQTKPQPGQQKPASGQPSPGQQKPSTPNQNPRDNNTSSGRDAGRSAQSVSDRIDKIGKGEDALDDDQADTETN
jgi:hypothetical protein